MVGIIVGGILGFITGFGLLNMNVKRSQWSTFFPIVTSITTLAGAFAGGRIGYNLERSDKIDRALGLHDTKHVHFQVGKSWQSESTWKDIKGQSHRLRTVKDTRSTASYFDGSLLINHGTSASSVNISKYHLEARNQAFKKLRDKHGEEYLAYVKCKETV